MNTEQSFDIPVGNENFLETDFPGLDLSMANIPTHFDPLPPAYRHVFCSFSVPVVITVYKDKKFDFIIKSPPASHFIKEAAKLKSGSQEPGRNIVASITKKQAEEIAKKKMVDLNAHDLEEAVKIIAGSARSMGIEVKD